MSIRDKLSYLGSLLKLLSLWAFGLFFLWIIIGELIIPYLFPAIFGLITNFFGIIIATALVIGAFTLVMLPPFTIIHYLMGDEFNFLSMLIIFIYLVLVTYIASIIF